MEIGDRGYSLTYFLSKEEPIYFRSEKIVGEIEEKMDSLTAEKLASILHENHFDSIKFTESGFEVVRPDENETEERIFQIVKDISEGEEPGYPELILLTVEKEIIEEFGSIEDKMQVLKWIENKVPSEKKRFVKPEQLPYYDRWLWKHGLHNRKPKKKYSELRMTEKGREVVSEFTSSRNILEDKVEASGMDIEYEKKGTEKEASQTDNPEDIYRIINYSEAGSKGKPKRVEKTFLFMASALDGEAPAKQVVSLNALSEVLGFSEIMVQDYISSIRSIGLVEKSGHAWADAVLTSAGKEVYERYIDEYEEDVELVWMEANRYAEIEDDFDPIEFEYGEDHLYSSRRDGTGDEEVSTEADLSQAELYDKEVENEKGIVAMSD